MYLRKLIAGCLSYAMILLPAYPVMADTPLFWPSERDFSSNSGYRADTPPCAADLDGDGDLDIVVGYETDSGVRIFENLGDGTYRMAKEIGVIDSFRDSTVVAADLDGDGDADLAAGTRSGVEILINDGDWNFTSKGSYAAGTWVAAGDLDHDGDIDLATDGAYVLLNDGSASFELSARYEATGTVAIADFTGDGHQDIAVSGRSGWLGTAGMLLVNDGRGNFAPGPELGSGSAYTVHGDFDRDGDEDIILNGWPGNAVLLNNGSGHFSMGESLPSGFQHLTVGDFSGDGILDLAGHSSSEVSVLIGRGDGTFSYSIQGYFGCGSAMINGGDVDNDGDLDVILTETDGCGEVGIIKNYGDGTLADDPTITDEVLGLSPEAVVIADFNGDGANDLAAGSRSRGGGNLRILLNDGKGAFEAGPLYDTTRADDIAAADVDGDGDVDLVTNGIDVLLNDGSGSFVPAATYAASGQLVEVADVDRDGDADIVTNNVSVLLNDGTGNFGTPIDYPDAGDGYWGEMILGDVNGDGYPDVAVVTGRWGGASLILLSLNDRFGGFMQTTAYEAAQYDPATGLRETAYGITMGDVDNDGDLDVATSVRYWQSGVTGNGARLRVFENDGSGNLAAPKTYDMLMGMNADAYGIERGDFNGDGHLDFAIVTCYHSVAIALNNGDGTFSNGGNYSGVCGMHTTDEIESGDLNGDGIPDLVVIEDVGVDGLRILLSNRGCDRNIAVFARGIIAQIDAQLAAGPTQNGVAGIRSDVEDLETLISSMTASGCLEKGEGQSLLAKAGAASDSVARAAEFLDGGKAKSCSNMLNTGKNQLSALLNELSGRK